MYGKLIIVIFAANLWVVKDRGFKSPILVTIKMIEKNYIKEIVEEKIEGSEIFLVDITVSKGNSVHVFVDSNQGLPIKTCGEISRFIESKLDREQEDYDMEVSSPGLDKPLKVHQQYVKNIGKHVKVGTQEFEKKGMLKSVSEEAIILEVEEKIDKKKKATIKKEIEINFKDIKSTKIVISFK